MSSLLKRSSKFKSTRFIDDADFYDFLRSIPGIPRSSNRDWWEYYHIVRWLLQWDWVRPCGVKDWVKKLRNIERAFRAWNAKEDNSGHEVVSTSVEGSSQL